MSAPRAVERLLVLSARIELSEEDRAELRGILSGGLDWASLLTEGGRLGAVPLLHRHLSRGEERLFVPPGILATLEKGYRAQGMRSLRMFGALLKILGVLGEEGIPVIPLKGAYLATQLYPDMALRPMSDIDLLCRPEDALRARDSILGLGYRAPIPEFYPNAVHERFGALTRQHLPRIINGVVGVEVHSRIFDENPSRTFSPESVWQESRECAMGEASFRCLCIEHQLLHLCTHLDKHINSGNAALYWFCDIHETLKRHQHVIDWKRFFDVAKELGAADQVRSVLHIVKHHWKSPVSIPEDGPPVRTRFDFLQQKVRRISYYSRAVARVAHIESTWDRFLYLWGFFFPSREFMYNRYPIKSKTMLVLYCAYRPFAVTARAGVSLIFSLFRALRKCA